MDKSHKFPTYTELEETKKKYRGQKIGSITKTTDSKLHVVLKPRKGSRACF